ncbi:MAG: hypothetical protein Q4E47_03280, partial [Candidatus Saccharibacteria bacterium]|nr:hypothetical protein [Candidatus Saccharibacteria bacterium]
MLKQKSFLQKHNKTLKFSILAGVSLLANLFFCSPVFAAPGIASSTSSTSTTVGNTVNFTVSFSKVASVVINMSGSGAGANCSLSKSWVEDKGLDTSKTFTISCKPTTTGTIAFKATGTCVGENDTTATAINVTKTVTVNAAPAPTPAPTPTP